MLFVAAFDIEASLAILAPARLWRPCGNTQDLIRGVQVYMDDFANAVPDCTIIDKHNSQLFNSEPSSSPRNYVFMLQSSIGSKKTQERHAILFDYLT